MLTGKLEEMSKCLLTGTCCAQFFMLKGNSDSRVDNEIEGPTGVRKGIGCFSNLDGKW